MSKYVARDSNGCRVLLFNGPKDTESNQENKAEVDDAESKDGTVVSMKRKITKKLNLPVE
jgi:hypothetical protein